MRDADSTIPETGADGLLLALKAAGIDYLFANAGTDFPPIIESLARLDPAQVPEPVLVPHETAGVAMAHGHYLATGRMQAAMVHVNVGLANAAMGMINAASDNVPVLVMSGRTPLTVRGYPGSRSTPIHYGQEMYDQSAMVAEPAKFHYELRYPDQAAPLVARAVSIAMSEPRGPTYLSLPREPLAAEVPEALRGPVPVPCPAAPPAPDPDAIAEAARTLADARAPLILAQRADAATGAAIVAFAERFAVPVAEPFATRNVMPSAHPLALGGNVGAALEEADVVLVLDADVPWIESIHAAGAGQTLIHVAPDPHFARMPYRVYRTDQAICAAAAPALAALTDALGAARPAWDARRKALADRAAARLETASDLAATGRGAPMSAEWISHCVSGIMDEKALCFNELGLVPAATRLKAPARLFTAPHSGGLGWGLPAALGAQLADRDRLCIACIGDGSFIFANPVACLQIAEALTLPVLAVIKNNAQWNAVRRSVLNSYPEGAAARGNRMPLVSLDPVPDFTRIAEASRAHARRVETGDDLPGALREAVEIIRTERRAAVLDVATQASDLH